MSYYPQTAETPENATDGPPRAEPPPAGISLTMFCERIPLDEIEPDDDAPATPSP